MPGLNFNSCGKLCCSSIPNTLKKKQKYKFGSPTHYDGKHPCYKKCPEGMTSKGKGKKWNTCYYKKKSNKKSMKKKSMKKKSMKKKSMKKKSMKKKTKKK